MRNIQARRHRRIVGPTLGERTRAGSHDPARLPPDPDEADVRGWEDEGGAVLSPERHGLRRRTVTAAGAVIHRT